MSTDDAQSDQPLPTPPEGIALAHFIVSADVERSTRFYTEVLRGRLAF